MKIMILAGYFRKRNELDMSLQGKKGHFLPESKI